jgi:glycosyltransferase involved in cell wall biosynthesis
VALSPSVRDNLVALGYRPDLVTVVSPGVSDTFAPGGERWPTPRIVTVCRLWPVKQVEVLVRAVARLRDRHHRVELVVVCDGPCRPALDALVGEMQAPVRFVGYVTAEALVELYRSAWVLATASVGEGWGMTVTEAAACGTPAVAADNSGHRHSVINGVTGLLAAGPDDLTAALDRVLTDATLRDRLGRAARDRASELSWDRTAAAMLDVLFGDAVRRRRTAGARGSP